MRFKGFSIIAAMAAVLIVGSTYVVEKGKPLVVLAAWQLLSEES
jgi:hypothetical protein